MSNDGREKSPPRKRRLLSTTALLTSVVLGTGGVAACEPGSGGRYKTEQQGETYQREVTRVEVDIDSGDVTVTKGDSGQVEVDRRLRWQRTKPTVREEWSGTTLRISAVCPDDKGCTVNYTVRVPESVTVRASTDSGDLSVSDINRDLDLSNKSGDITVENARGKVRLQGESGQITGRQLHSTDVRAQLTSGDIALRFAAAPDLAEADTRSGDIRITVPRAEGGYRVRANVTDGRREVDVDVNSGSSRTINAQIESGNLGINHG